MDTNSFDKLIKHVDGAFFTGSKKKHIHKSEGMLTGEQIYRLVGQFTSSEDRKDVLHDLFKHGRILPMPAAVAEPIVTMGIYPATKCDFISILATLIIDRQDNKARDTLKKSFSHSEKKWIDDVLSLAGPYVAPGSQPAGQAPPPPIMYPQQGHAQPDTPYPHQQMPAYPVYPPQQQPPADMGAPPPYQPAGHAPPSLYPQLPTAPPEYSEKEKL